MQLKEFDILLDIKKHNKPETFEVVQGDSYSNVLNITLVDGLNSFNLTNTNVEIVFNKSDGTTVQQTDISVLNASQGKIQCVLKTNTIASPGKVIAEVRVLEGDILLTSTRFEFYVRKSLINDETIESTNEFPILTQLINDVEPILDAVPVIEEKLGEINDTESDLNQSILEGNTLKTDLDSSISQGNILKPQLEDVIDEGEGLKGELADIIEGTDFEQVIADLNNKVDKEVVGELSTLDTTDKSNIVNALNEVNNKSVDLTPVEDRIDDLEDVLATHKAENVSEIIVVTRDLSLSGTQIVEGFSRVPKRLDILCVVANSKKMSIGNVSPNAQNVIFNREDGAYSSTSANSIYLAESGSKHTRGTITINSNKTISISWNTQDGGAVGSAGIRIIAHYHGED